MPAKLVAKVGPPLRDVIEKAYSVAEVRVTVTAIGVVPYPVLATPPVVEIVALPVLLTLNSVRPADLRSKPLFPAPASQFIAQSKVNESPTCMLESKNRLPLK